MQPKRRSDFWFKIRISKIGLVAALGALVVIAGIVVAVKHDQIPAFIRWSIGKTIQEVRDNIHLARLEGVNVALVESVVVQTNQAGKELLENHLMKARELANKGLEDIKRLRKINDQIQRGRKATFTEVHNNVRANRVKEVDWLQALKGMSLTAGSKIKTGDDSNAEMEMDDNRNMISIRANSFIVLKDMSINENSGDLHDFVSHEHGVTEYKLNDEMTIESKQATVSGHGNSEFALRTKRNELQIRVTRGIVDVENPQGEKKEVASQQVLSVSNDGVFGEILKVPPAPTLVEPANTRTFFFDERSVVNLTLKWSRVHQVVRYRVQVARDRLFKNVIIDRYTRVQQHVLKNLVAGNYYWRIASEDRSGLSSEPSSFWSFAIDFEKGGMRKPKQPPVIRNTAWRWHDHATVEIEGVVSDPNAILLINGADATLKADGSFREWVEVLDKSQRFVILEVRDSEGGKTQKRIRIRD